MRATTLLFALAFACEVAAVLQVALVGPLPPQAARATLKAAPGPVPLDGYYRVRGQTPRGEYEGVVVLVRRPSDYFYEAVGVNGELAVGVGHLTGDVLSVSWHAGGATGLTTFHVKGACLFGRWTSVADGGCNEETLTYLGPLVGGQDIPPMEKVE